MTHAKLPYRLKIERAYRHIEELSTECNAFYARKPFSVYRQDDTTAGQRSWKVKISENVPQHFSGIVGDAIHNARAALDLLAVAVVKHCDPNRASYNHVYFVIRETKEEFEAALRKCMKGASPAALEAIRELKPYKEGNESSRQLHQLDILDKHKAIIPVGSAHRNVGITFDFAKMFPSMKFPENAKQSLHLRPTDSQFPLQDGATLFVAGLEPDVAIDEQVHFTFQLALGEGQIIDGEPVIPTPTQMCQFVEGVFSTVEAQVLRQG